MSRFDIEHILACGENNQRIQIIECLVLEHINDRNKLFEIMSIVEDCPHNIQKNIILLLMKNKCSKDILLRIPIAGGPHSWSGSRVPHIENNLQLLEDLKKELKENKLLEYEPVINQYMQWNKKQLLRAQIEEYNEGYL